MNSHGLDRLLGKPSERFLDARREMWRRHRTQVGLIRSCVATELHFVWFKITPTGTPIASLSALAEKTDVLAA